MNMLRKYEDPSYLQENRLKQRSYYIPENEGGNDQSERCLGFSIL